MFTKSVTVCALGGMFLATPLPGNLLVWNVQAQKAPAKIDTQSSCQNTASSASASSSSRKTRRQQRLRPSESKAPQCPAVSTAQAKKDAGAHLGTFSVTAYTHYRDSSDGVNETATGTLPAVGRTVAVDPRVIPLGSRIYIAGIGERIAEDTGGKIKGKKLDLFLPSIQACLRFGVRRYEVRILDTD